MVIAEAVLTFVLCGAATAAGGVSVYVSIDDKDAWGAIIGLPLILLGIVTAVFQGIVLAM